MGRSFFHTFRYLTKLQECNIHVHVWLAKQTFYQTFNSKSRRFKDGFFFLSLCYFLRQEALLQVHHRCVLFFCCKLLSKLGLYPFVEFPKKVVENDGRKLARHIKNRGRPTEQTWQKYRESRRQRNILAG